MADDDLPTLGDFGGRQKQVQQEATPDSTSKLGRFFQSAVSAGTGELVGYDPGIPEFLEPFAGEASEQEIQRYRAQNPGAGLGSQMLGMAPFFVAPLSRVGMQAISRIPVLGGGITRGTRLIEGGSPATGMMARDVTAVGAAELGRVGTTAALHGPFSEETQEIGGEAVFDVAATAALAGGLGFLRHGLPPAGRVTGTEQQFQKIDPSYNINDPPQIKAQKIARALPEIENEGLKLDLQKHVAKFGTEARRQDIPSGRRAVQKLAISAETDNRNVSRKISEMWKTAKTRDRWTRKITGGPKTKSGMSSKKINEVQKSMPAGWEKNAYLPRHLMIRTKDQARRFQKTLGEMSSAVNAGGRQAWIAREVDDGPYVMVRRMDERFDDVRPGDEFVMFKTDNPSFFGPELGKFSRVMDQDFFRMQARQRASQNLGKLTRAADALEDQGPSVGVLSGEMSQEWSAQRIGRRWLSSLLGEQRIAELRQTLGDTSDWIGKVSREFFAPTIHRYAGRNGSARAASLSMFTKAIMDRARMEATHHLSGELKRTYKNAIWKDIFKAQAPREGGVLRRIDSIPEDAMPDISEAVRRNLSIREMRDANMHDEAISFMRFLDQKDRAILDDVNRTLRELGEAELQGMSNHYMLTRMWEGRLRLPIVNQKNQLIAVASGKNKKQAIAEADELVDVLKNEGVQAKYNQNKISYADLGDDLKNATQIRSSGQHVDWLKKARNPKRFEKRAGVRGFRGERQDLTHKDLREMLGRQIREMYEFTGQKVVDHRTMPGRTKLAGEDQKMSQLLEREISTRFGQRGGWTKQTEDAVDEILTPLFGVRASEIVRTVNEAVFSLTLGMANIGFAALNALTFMQTTLPEIATVLGTVPSRNRNMYGHAIVNTPNGVGKVSYLEPLKMLRQGMNDMSNPPDELWEFYKRARDEGRVAPVLSEEVFGPNSDIIRHLQGFFKGQRTMIETIREASAYLPARTEEMSRSIGLSLGWRLGKDFMGLQGEQLYQFAARFVDNTHFRYAAADRPQLMRGAFGSLVGLFKSWMLHYIGNMARYSGEAWRQRNLMPLLWAQGGTMSVAGLSGSPVMMVAEGLNDLASDDPLVQNIYEGLGWQGDDLEFFGSPADGLYYGIPAFLNLGLSHRAAVPGADVPGDIEQLYSIMHWDRAVAIGDLVGSTIDAYYATGEHPMKSQQVADAFHRAFLPRTAQALMKNLNQRGTRSLNTQNTILSDTTWYEATMDTMGFQPNRVARAYEQMDILFERQEERQEAISAYGEMLAQAQQAGDTGAIQNVLMRAQYQGIPIDRIMSSADSRLAKREEGIIERQFDDLRSQALRRALGGDAP